MPRILFFSGATAGHALTGRVSLQPADDLGGGAEGGGGGQACAGMDAGAAEEKAANGGAIAGRLAGAW